MATGKTGAGIYWSFVALVCLIRGALLIPNVDDGINYLHLYNTMGWHYPFYNDYFGQLFHFNRPLILLYSLLYSLIGSPSFRLIALIQSAGLFACVYVLYACVRRYASEEASRAASLIVLYFLFVQLYLSPTRPETTVLLCALAVFWLCERFSDTGRVICLCGAGALVFLIALPMHTNGSIPFLYLAFFVAAQRRRLSSAQAIKCAACALLCALTGAAMLLYPHVASLAQSLALFSYDGSRFGMLKGEWLRFWYFMMNFVNYPLMLLILSFMAAIQLSAGKEFRLAGLKRYRSVLLFLLAVVLGQGILPAATWEVYMVYYFLPLAVGFAAAFDRYRRRTHHHYLEGLLPAAVGLATLWHGYGMMPELYFILCALPFLPAAALSGRLTPMQILAVIVIPMLLFGMVTMGASNIIHGRAERRIQETGQLVVAHPLFNFSGENVLQAGIYDVHSARGGAHALALRPVAWRKAGRIRAHPLVQYFGDPPALHKRSRYDSRYLSHRMLGKSFLLLTNNEWDYQAYFDTKVKPLGYEVCDDTPLAGMLLNRYANFSMRELRCVEYRQVRPAEKRREAGVPGNR